MGLTDKCDIYASFHEDGLNRIIQHVMRQRPSLFNYATQDVLSNPALFCQPISVHPIVTARNNPLATVIDLLPIPGTSYGLNFAVQLHSFEFDFHPGSQFSLPPELTPPLSPQSFALHLQLCVGLGCPTKEVLDEHVPPPQDPKGEQRQEDGELQPLPARRLLCFCLHAYVVGKMIIRQYYNKSYLEMQLAGLEIVDIEPTRLEDSMECYLRCILRLAVLPKLRILLERTVLSLRDYMKQPVVVGRAPTPAPGVVPNNPAVEDDQIKLFVNLEVT